MERSKVKSDIWADGWKERVYERVMALGFPDVTAFSASAPCEPYRLLSPKLGDDIAPVQLEKLMREEAIESGKFALFARDCLARYLRQNLPDGWARGDDSEFRTARSFASWSAALSLNDDKEIDSQTRKIWDKLRQIAPTGWQVEGMDDPVLLRAFDSANFII
jgi:hypothetical protein